MVTIDYMTSYD